MERFKREGEILRRLNHPNIVQMLDAVEKEGQHYLIMELIEGGSLREKLDRRHHLEIHEVLSLAIEIVDALTRAHHLKVIHRDIKPANVMLAADGTPRLTDFGIAQVAESNATKTGTIVGTLNYISPEILQGKSANSRTDVWSFGVMLFEMVSGTLPFKSGENIGVIVHSILNDPVPDIETLRADTPTGLIDLINRMITKEPAERIPSFRLVGAELESILEGRDPGAARFNIPAQRYDSVDTFDSASNLPAQTTPFLGRTVELAALKQLLDNPEVRLITILAPGGMGKTAISLEAVRRIRNRFPQGVTFIPLARIPSAEYLIQAISEELGLALSSQDDPKVQLLNYLKNAEMLLLLDNFEHVLDGAWLIQEILQSAPHMKILTTSRERLNLAGEVPYSLRSMSIAEWQTVEEAMTYGAVQLFVQGARRSRSDFLLQQKDMSALTRICRFVDGMPLGILLAAAWVDMISVEEIAGEIEKSIDFLETELRDVPDRQRSVRSVLDSTWLRLDLSDQELFMKLSVFRSSFSRNAAEKIAGASLRQLAKLISKSLITRDAESGRYHIHELLRQYAQQKLEDSAQSSRNVRATHATYYADFMKDRWTDLKDHRMKTALQEIQDDIENVRAAWRYWLEVRNGTELRKFFEGLWAIYEIRSWFRPAADLFREAGEQLQEGESSIELQIARAYALAMEGWFTSLLGLPHLGIEMARKSLAIFRQIDSGQDLFLVYSSLNINGIFLNLLDEIQSVEAKVDPWNTRIRKDLDGFSSGTSRTDRSC